MTAGLFLIHSGVLMQRMRAAMHALTAGAAWQSHMALAAVEVVDLGLMATLLLDGCGRMHLSDDAFTDLGLVRFSLLLPVAHVAMVLLDPVYLQSPKTWPAAMAFLIGFAVVLGHFPPAHSFVQLAVSTPAFAFISCWTRLHTQQQQQCSGSSEDGASLWAQLPPCLLTEGLAIGAAGLAAWATTYHLMRKHQKRLSQHHKGGDAEQSDTPSPPPFKSLSIRLFSCLGPAIQKLEAWANAAVDSVSEGFLVRLTCAPVAVSYGLYACLCRAKVQNWTFELTPDQFILCMLAWFLVGRESCSFDILPAMQQIQAQLSASFAKQAHKLSVMELVDNVRMQVLGAGQPRDLGASASAHNSTLAEVSAASGDVRPEDRIRLLERLGEGVSGKVFKGVWRGTTVAVKSMILPSNASGAAKRGRMAILEAAISSALRHPNIVQTFTYTIVRIDPAGGTVAREALAANSSDVAAHWSSAAPCDADEAGSQCFEVRLVLEYADCGTLHDALARGAFRSLPSPAFTSSSSAINVIVSNLLSKPSSALSEASADASPTLPAAGTLNYWAVLATAADIAKGMLHLHALNVIHADLKSRNVLLLSSATDPRGFTAKVSDFGMSLKMDYMQTHISNLYHGTPTHQAPEVFVHGYQSKAADVYAFGITMWEIYTGGVAYKGLAKALMGHYIGERGLRPAFPADAPPKYVMLATRCWNKLPDARPTFKEIVAILSEMCEEEAAPKPPS